MLGSQVGYRLHTQDQPRDASKTPGHKIQHPSEHHWLNIPRRSRRREINKDVGYGFSMEIPCEARRIRTFWPLSCFFLPRSTWVRVLVRATMTFAISSRLEWESILPKAIAFIRQKALVYSHLTRRSFLLMELDYSVGYTFVFLSSCMSHSTSVYTERIGQKWLQP